MNGVTTSTDVLRIGTVVFEREGYADELLALLRDCPGLFAELAFFTGNFHSPMPLDRLREVAGKLEPVLSRFRTEGWRVGINHLTTIGHHEENMEDAVDQALRRQVGFDGQVCRGALCPADPDVLAYVRESYHILTAAGPDYYLGIQENGLANDRVWFSGGRAGTIQLGSRGYGEILDYGPQQQGGRSFCSSDHQGDDQ
jgi:hypothetical protein